MERVQEWRPFQYSPPPILPFCAAYSLEQHDPSIVVRLLTCRFFDKSLVEKEDGPPNQPHPDLMKLDVTCAADGDTRMILGDAEGFVHLIDKTFVKTQFQAYDVRVHLMQHLKVWNVSARSQETCRHDCAGKEHAGHRWR